jgi:integrative and conjugative element protein (TIGR02256 family)
MKLIVTQPMLHQLQAELSSARRREIGGLLLGEHVEGETFRLSEVTVQRTGGSAAHFVRDPALNQRQLDEFFERTGRDYARFNYLGEWHSHPSFEPLPSTIDIQTMQSIVEDPAVGVNFLVLLIVTLKSRKYIHVSAKMFQAGVNPRDVQVTTDEVDAGQRSWICGALAKLFGRL